MTPFENIGPYSETTITTRKSDVTDNKPGGWYVVIALCLIGPAMWTLFFMGLFLWKHIGLIGVSVVIGLGFWACGHYGTNRSILDRYRYRTTPEQRACITRSLSDIKDSEKK